MFLKITRITSTAQAAQLRAGESGAVVTLTTSMQQKSVSGLTSRAGVPPMSASVTFLSTDLMRITGAQEPSGHPCVSPIVENKGLTVELRNLVQIQIREGTDHVSASQFLENPI